MMSRRHHHIMFIVPYGIPGDDPQHKMTGLQHKTELAHTKMNYRRDIMKMRYQINMHGQDIMLNVHNIYRKVHTI